MELWNASFKNSRHMRYRGFLPDTHIMLPVCESGGVSLEWFKNACMNGTDYNEINEKIKARKRNDILFLPYLVGTNSPEFDNRATGVFWGLRGEHDCFDMAYAVMEGVEFLFCIYHRNLFFGKDFFFILV